LAVNGTAFTVVDSLLAGGLIRGCFYRGKTPENEEFAMAGAILEVRENRSGGSDTVRGRGWGSERKTVCPKTRLRHIVSGGLSRISLACDRPSIMFCKRAIQNKLTCSALVRFFGGSICSIRVQLSLWHVQIFNFFSWLKKQKKIPTR